MYDYKESKKRIEAILSSPTNIIERDKIPISDSGFTFENGIRAGVGAIFIDIVESKKLFKDAHEDCARIIRSFCSEVISILKEDENYRQIGIRGDCVYGIFNAPYKNDLVKIFDLACTINTFIIMFNKLLKKKKYQEIKVGIGLGFGRDLIIKAGQSGTGINDKIWIGDAAVDASHLSGVANRGAISQIAMSEVFYDNVIDILISTDSRYKSWINPYSRKLGNYSSKVEYYHCSIVFANFEKWINEEI